MTELDQLILRTRVIPVLRAPRIEAPARLAGLLCAAGLPIVEFTMTTENALESLQAARKIDGAVLGMGTVLTTQQARQAVDAGADFLVAPTLEREVARGVDCPVMLAGATPTEIRQAYSETGWTVKVFPASTLGPSFVAAVTSVLPSIPVVASGGIDETNISEFLSAGASAVATGSVCSAVELFSGDYSDVAHRCERILRAADDS